MASDDAKKDLAKVVLARSLIYFYYVDPNWTKKQLLPSFDWKNSSEATIVWEAYAYSRQIADPELFATLKDSFLAAMTSGTLSETARDKFAEHLMLMLVETRLGNAWPIKALEAKSVLASVADGVRRHAAWFLWRWFAGRTAEDRGKIWRKVISPVLAQAWPHDAALRSPEVTRDFVLLALENTDGLPRAAKDIEPLLLRSSGPANLLLHQLSSGKLATIARHSKALLRLLVQVVDTTAESGPYGLGIFLRKLQELEPSVVKNPDWKELEAFSLRSGT